MVKQEPIMTKLDNIQLNCYGKIRRMDESGGDMERKNKKRDDPRKGWMENIEG